uniref:AN1-type zinc finger protein 1 isoform X2 n=1 Tax=Geotrypetes seraphini TaxID=260995 RepID=A0A6P8Q0V9_GEOSA|nr:AN1-type zinc finger protein 1 isoform X2 [Geotrypetes seraphini]XP_033789844.1 AN1-type zinc finger protein 1 isoform X3 [Geotrypetes seraphini]
MAELDVGQHCGVKHCGQLDFLPFVCSYCSGVYCLEHRSRASHGCLQDSTRNESVKSEGHTIHPCTFRSCDEKELVLLLCPFCDKHFCLRHRHQSDHECEKLECTKPRMAATKQLVQEIVESKKCSPRTRGRKGAKSSETAARVALMKLKLHALGERSLPQSERIYFQVLLPKESKERSVPMFFCNKWSIGKVVDFAASLANLRNDNNKSTAKGKRTISLQYLGSVPKTTRSGIERLLNNFFSALPPNPVGCASSFQLFSLHAK